MSVPAAEAAGLPERVAARALQVGAAVAVLAASTLTPFDLDRFLIPKELVLHATALLAGLLAIRAAARTIGSRLDLMLIVYLLISAISAVFATNGWLGFRALAISASGVVVFWIARALRRSGLTSRLLSGVAFAVVLTAITCLLQTYGLRIIFFSINRAPGGTLGNRNFVAHVAAFGFPICLLVAVRARRWMLAAIGVALVSAALVITRSRAAWLAAAIMAAIFIVSLIASAARRDTAIWKRTGVAFLFAIGGAGLALLLPNTLHWRGENPYLESMRTVTNYEAGSGRGRLVQYRHSLAMAVHSPLLGVGPGNWPVDYPRFVPRSDPSMNPSVPGMTFNPWPSSDWMAIVSERGFLAAILWIAIVIAIAASALRRIFAAQQPSDGLDAAALLATLAAAVVAGLFDAVLILPLPSLLVWTSIGVLYDDEGAGEGARRHTFMMGYFAILAICAAGAVRSAAQLDAMQIYASSTTRAALERAVHIDPGSYPLHLRLARAGARRDRCAHARAAHALFPYADGARNLDARCGE